MRKFSFLKTGAGKKLTGLAALLAVLMFITGFAWSYKKVHIAADGVDYTVATVYNTPEAVLSQAGIAMGPQDEYRLAGDKLINGATISVYRAVPVNLIYQGQTKQVMTAKPTVGELAAALGLLREDIGLVPGETTPVQAGMSMQAVVLAEKIIQRQVPEPFPIIRQPDSTLEKGQEESGGEGRDGIRTQTVRLKFADGVPTGEEIIDQQVTEPPTPEIIRVGVRDTVETSRGAMRFRRIEYMEATAYTPNDGGGQGITASGLAAQRGMAAVDPAVIPLGTRLYIAGYGMALASDTGGDIIGSRIDLCMDSYSEAYQFGRRTVKVYVLAD